MAAKDELASPEHPLAPTHCGADITDQESCCTWRGHAHCWPSSPPASTNRLRAARAHTVVEAFSLGGRSGLRAEAAPLLARGPGGSQVVKKLLVCGLCGCTGFLGGGLDL